MSEVQTIITIALAAVAVLLLIIAGVYFAGMIVYYTLVFAKNDKLLIGEYDMMKSEQYQPYVKIITDGIDYMKTVEFENITIDATDGIKLFGRYFENKKGGPLVLFFHGYRGTSFRDGSGIFAICKRRGYNILLTDQRAHGNSGGKTTTFGIKERYDCEKWIEYAAKRWGSDTEILLAGMSMGAATVLMASSLEMKGNVKGVIADCGFSSPKEIVISVMKSMGVPVKFAYRLGYRAAKVIGRFNMEEYSAIEAMKNCRFPVLFIHGDDDRFVPCYMSEQCFEACVTDKDILLVQSAGHGLSHCVDAKKYEEAVDRFCDKYICAN